eukprot:3250127-Pleurochrysis_carterae.AAC.1
MIITLRFLDCASSVASPSTQLSRSRYLLQSLAFLIATSDRDDDAVVRTMSVMCGGRSCYYYKQGQLLPEHTATP